MTLREKIARTVFESEYADSFDDLDPKGIDYALQFQKADAVLALLSDPANISDGMVLAMIAHYEMMSHDPPAPKLAQASAVATLAEAPALKERIRESFAAAFASKEQP